MPSHPTRLLLCVLFASGVHSASAADPNTLSKPAAAAPRFTLLTASGAAIRPPLCVSLLSITPDLPDHPARVIYLDPAGSQKSIPLRDIIALAPATWVPTPESTAPTIDAFTSDLPVPRLDLTDSQRFVGTLLDAPRPSGASRGAELPVVIRHERLGTLGFPLDRVLRYSAMAGRTPDLGGRPLSTSADTVLLSNTDRLEGLVTRLGPVVAIETASATADPKAPAPGPTLLDAAQVVLVHLVNPSTRLDSLRVDLADGTVVAVDALAAEARLGTLSIHPIDAPAATPQPRPAGAGTPASFTLDLGQLTAVVPDPSRLTPLSSLPIGAQAPTGDRPPIAPARVLSDAAAPLGAADILLPAPMSVEWAIPAGATSLIGYAQMDDRSFSWGDCTAVVSIVPRSGPERQLARARLNADSPTLTVAADLGKVVAGDRLRIRTEPGERGPIQDRVVLRRMVLLGK